MFLNKYVQNVVHIENVAISQKTQSQNNLAHLWNEISFNSKVRQIILTSCLSTIRNILYLYQILYIFVYEYINQGCLAGSKHSVNRECYE